MTATLTAAPHVERAVAYARGVVAREIDVCRWVRFACARHLADVERSAGDDYPFAFDAAKAERACRFAELMPHVKGHWAAEGRLIVLEPFQCFRRAMLFGWVEKATGFRRFRESYEERPRKNAKSTDAAIDGLYCFAADGEYGAEVYCGATSEKQAWEVFRPAKQMAERTLAFREQYGVTVNAKSLTILETGSRFEPVIGKPGDGPSPSLAITDEYHEHLDSTFYDTMVTGMGARRQPLALVITTAGEDIEGPCYAMRERATRMLDGTLPDERLFAVIYTIDEGDDWTSEAALRKANPNFDVSVSGEFLRQQQRKAINDAREQATVKLKHLNVWGSARSPWMNLEWWNRQADATLSPEQFVGASCTMAFDLANRTDLVAAVKLFRRTIAEQEQYYLFGRYYVPEAAVHDPKNRHYQKWAAEGHLIATEGNDCDLPGILADVRDDKLRFDITQAGLDPWNSIGLAGGLKDLGIEPVEIPQQVQYFSEPMKAIEAAVKDGRFHHDGNPCLAWMVANVTVRPDAKDNIFPRKERPEKKIDGAVAAVMAMRLEPAVSGGIGLL